MRKIFMSVTLPLFGIAVCLLIVSQGVSVKADEQINQIDEFIEANELGTDSILDLQEEPGTVSLSYAEWQEQQTAETEPNVYEMDVWTLGSYLYGISELDTTRALKLITYEGYGYSPLSYYVACCCWVRSTEGLWGYNNLYQAFGEADTSYDEWLDCIEIADYAYEYLRECYLNPSYVKYCNGMTIPNEWIYEENGIYCWN